MRVAEEECSSRTERNRGRKAKGADARGRMGREGPGNGKRGTCFLLDAPKTTRSAPGPSKTHNITKLQLNKKFQ